MTGFMLRVKTKHGQDVLTTLGPNSTVRELKQELSKIADVPIGSLYVLSGTPPQHLNLAEDKKTLESSNIVSGDTLVVKDAILEEETVIKDHSYQDSQNRGVLIKKSVPADNCCLFTSIAFTLSGEVNSNCAPFMRKIIAEAVENDPETYNEAILGRPNKEYCEWIQEPTSWGGAIELAILSKFYGVEIVVLDSVNGILNRFGEDQSYDYRIFLLFDGTHYDPLYLDNSLKKPTTEFRTSDERILQEAESLVKETNANRQFTDINRFTLKCLECNIFLTGQVEAGRHAKETGHQSFGELKSE